MGLSATRRADLVMAVNELATNSVRHAGGSGRLGIWREGDALLCEVRDSGQFDWPRLGRRRPPADQVSGRGLWIVDQLCDLVQFRRVPGGSAVRVGMRLG